MRALLAVGALVVSLVRALPTVAQTVEIAPVTTTLAPGQCTASLTVTNRGTTSVTIQVRPFRWTEPDGTSALAETAGLAVSPPIAEVPPGQTQSIRLLLRQPPGETKATYRLLIDQLPPAERASAIRIALRFSVPIFALPDRAAVPELHWSVESDGRRSFLAVHNAGGRHAAIFAAQAGGTAVKTTTHPYVLPGATVRWPIEGGRSWAGAVPLVITSDGGTSTATAPVVRAAP